MNFELGSDEEALIEAVRDALSRTDTLAAARSTLDGAPPVHLWKEAVRGGWTDMPGLLYAVLVLIECGRRLAPTGLLGHLTVTSVLRDPALLDGTHRAAYIPASGAEYRSTSKTAMPTTAANESAANGASCRGKGVTVSQFFGTAGLYWSGR